MFSAEHLECIHNLNIWKVLMLRLEKLKYNTIFILHEIFANEFAYEKFL